MARLSDGPVRPSPAVEQLIPCILAASTLGQAGLKEEAKSGIGTVRELLVFPLLWMPDVSICLQFGQGEIPGEKEGREQRRLLPSLSAHQPIEE